jgi:menaquinone-9 beta-reductase
VAIGIDLLVVGAGPAGLATAIAARQFGLNVMVVDGRRPPIDKACGEGLMPDGVPALLSLGVQPANREAVPLHGIRFVSGGLSAEARFAGAPGLGIRRTVLQGLLVERAAGLGVAMRWGTRVDSIDAGCVSLGGDAVTYKWIVGADGQNSRIRTLAGLRPAAM